MPKGTHASPSTNRDTFVSLFENILERKIQGHDIVFDAESAPDMRLKLRNLVETTFNVFTSLHGPLSPTTDSSSSRSRSNNVASLVGGSSTHVSHPSNGSSQQMTGSTMSTTNSAPAPPYTLNMNNSATSPQYSGIVPMARQRSQFQNPLPNQLSPALQPQVPMGAFSTMPQENLNNYYPVYPGQQWQFGVPYQQMPSFAGNGQLSMTESEFYSQTEDFTQGAQNMRFDQ